MGILAGIYLGGALLILLIGLLCPGEVTKAASESGVRPDLALAAAATLWPYLVARAVMAQL